jgi:hypothetical protein
VDVSTGQIIDTDARCVRLAASALHILAEYSDGGTIEAIEVPADSANSNRNPSPSYESTYPDSNNGNNGMSRPSRSSIALLPTGHVFKRLQKSLNGLSNYFLMECFRNSSLSTVIPDRSDSLQSELDGFINNHDLTTQSRKTNGTINSPLFSDINEDSKSLWEALKLRPPCRWQEFSALVEVASRNSDATSEMYKENAAFESSKRDDCFSLRFLLAEPKIRFHAQADLSASMEGSVTFDSDVTAPSVRSGSTTVPVDVVVDIAHNPPAIAALARRIQREFGGGSDSSQMQNIQ